jgi:hypothetical protein
MDRVVHCYAALKVNIYGVEFEFTGLLGLLSGVTHWIEKEMIPAGLKLN